jgi:hypothetical protein
MSSSQQPIQGVSNTAARYSYPQLGFKNPALAPGQFGIGTADQYSIGANSLTIEAFIARLQAAQVKTVLDVRELPLSRKKGF